MDEGLLRTKLFVPPVTPQLVPRPRLLERLNGGLAPERKLTLVSAPAGFGKTTLVAAWIRALSPAAAESTRTAWLALDEADNDFARFLTYLIAALQQVAAHVGETALAALRASRPSPAEAVLTPLINDIAALDFRIVIVIDDFHLIDNPDIHQAVAALLQHRPPRLHLALLTREDPPLPLARWRAQDQLTELRALDLRFTPAEVATFFHHAGTPALSAADIEALAARTEGWVAGLQLVALSLRGSADAGAFVRSFSGSHHFVLDYLVEEVLEQQEPHVQAFLLQTAVLERMTGALCDALTGRSDGRQLLDALERANLFLVPLDPERRWFRYHHLFADLLRQRLRHSGADGTGPDVAALYRRASAWYAAEGHVEEAVDYALRAGDTERAADLIASAMAAGRHRRNYARLRAWLQRLPAAALAPRPQLAVLHAEGLLITGQQEAAEAMLQLAERGAQEANNEAAPGTPGLPSDARRQLRGRIAAARALLAFYRGDVAGALAHGQRALADVPEDDPEWRESAANGVGNAHIIMGDMPQALHAHTVARAASQAAGNTYMSLIIGVKLAVTLRQLGRLDEAVGMCRQQLQLAGQHRLSQSPVAGWARVVWAEVQAERNDLEGAREQVALGLDQLRQAGAAADVAMLSWSYLCQIRILFSSGRYAQAVAVAGDLLRLARDADVPPWIAARAAPWPPRVWLAQGELDAAAGWAAQRDVRDDGEPTFFDEAEWLLRARIALAQGRLDEAAGLLQHLLIAARRGSRTGTVLEILILQARTFYAAQDAERALAALADAFEVAEPAGFFRIFVDEGPPLAPLLREALARALAPQYVRRLLAAFPAEDGEPAGPTPVPADRAPLIEPLSERELEVLRNVAEGLTNRQIAERLYLSLNTVKVHTRNIYGKLGVHSRTQAVARARELDLLSS